MRKLIGPAVLAVALFVAMMSNVVAQHAMSTFTLREIANETELSGSTELAGTEETGAGGIDLFNCVEKNSSTTETCQAMGVITEGTTVYQVTGKATLNADNFHLDVRTVDGDHDWNLSANWLINPLPGFDKDAQCFAGTAQGPQNEKFNVEGCLQETNAD